MNIVRFSRVCLSWYWAMLFVAAVLLVLRPFDTQAKTDLLPTGVTRYVSLNGDDTANACTNSTFPCRTVQWAIGVAQAGDEVRVAQGTYTGTMAEPNLSGGAFSATVVLTKNLSALLGGYSTDFATRNPDTNETILSAVDAPRKFVVFISNTTTLIDGFTMTGATGSCPTDCANLGSFGGAIQVRGGAPTISHNRIQGNRAYYSGGGIAVVHGGTPLIASNLIYSNTASFYLGSGGKGGGIYIETNASAAITGNVIISNVADVEGGGIYVGWNAPASIISNTIAYNQVISTTGGRGGGVRTNGGTAIVNISHNEVYANTTLNGGGSGFDIGSPAIVDGNLIHHNRGVNWGAAAFVANSTLLVTLTNNIVIQNYGTGIQATNFSQAQIVNNTVAENTFVSSGTPGNGIDVSSGLTSTAFVLNNIVIDNATCGMSVQSGAVVTIDYNDVLGNLAGDYCAQAAPPGGTHNISADPQFVNGVAGNYHIRFGSPVMNTGTSLNAPIDDRDGVIRPQMGRVDMGAYEVVAPHSVYLPIVLK